MKMHKKLGRVNNMRSGLIARRAFFKGLGVIIISIVMIQVMGCGKSKKDPAAYSNELIGLMNLNESQLGAMNQAMGALDFARAETVRINWEDLLEGALKKVKSVGDYKGDDQLQMAVMSSLRSYQLIVQGPYKSLISLRSQADPASSKKEQALVSRINQGFTNAGNEINRSLYAFQKAYTPGD